MDFAEEDEDVIYDNTNLLRQKNKKYQYFRNRFLVFISLTAIFICLGLSVGILGPTLPCLEALTKSREDQAALVFAGRAVGCLGGWLLSRLLLAGLPLSVPPTGLLLSGMGVLGLANLLIPWPHHIWWLMPAFALQGAAMAAVETSGLAVLQTTIQARSSRCQNMVLFVVTLGCVTAPLLTLPFLDAYDCGVLLPGGNLTHSNLGHLPSLSRNRRASDERYDTLNMTNWITTTVTPEKTKINQIEDTFENVNTPITKTASTLRIVEATTPTVITTTVIRRRKPIIKSKKPGVADGKLFDQNTKSADGSIAGKKMQKQQKLDRLGKKKTSLSIQTTTPSINITTVVQATTSINTTRIVQKTTPSINSTTVVQTTTSINTTRIVQTTTPSINTITVTSDAVTTVNGQDTHLETVDLNQPSNLNTTTTEMGETTAPSTIPVGQTVPILEDTRRSSTESPPQSTSTTSSSIQSTTHMTPTTLSKAKLTTHSTITHSSKNIPTIHSTTNKMADSSPSSTPDTTTTLIVTPSKPKNEVKKLSKPESTQPSNTFLTHTWKSTKQIISKMQPVQKIFVLLGAITIVTALVSIPLLLDRYCCCCCRPSSSEMSSSLLNQDALSLNYEDVVQHSRMESLAQNEAPDYADYSAHQWAAHVTFGQIVGLSLLGMTHLFYAGMEVSFGGFLFSYAVRYLNWSTLNGLLVTVTFWSGVLLGRFTTISRCWGPRFIWLHIIATLVAAVLLTLTSFDHWFWMSTAYLGLAISGLLPALLAWTEHVYRPSAGPLMSPKIGSRLGEMFLPVLTGYLHRITSPFGTPVLMYLTLTCAVMTAVGVCGLAVLSRFGRLTGAGSRAHRRPPADFLQEMSEEEDSTTKTTASAMQMSKMAASSNGAKISENGRGHQKPAKKAHQHYRPKKTDGVAAAALLDSVSDEDELGL